VTKILFLANAYMMDGSYEPYTQAIIDYLLASGQELMVVKTNCYFDGLSDIPLISEQMSHVEEAIRAFDPEVVFSINRNGLARNIIDCFKRDIPIITWFFDPYNRLPQSLMNFSHRDFVYMIMMEVGMGQEKKVDFLSRFNLPEKQFFCFPFFLDTFRFRPLGLERTTDVCFVGTGFSMPQFGEWMRYIETDAHNRDIFVQLYLEHKNKYIYNFYGQLINCGFDFGRIINPRIASVEPSELQHIIDVQLSLEKRTRYVSALSEFNFEFYGQPISNWVDAISIVNSDLLKCFRYQFVNNYDDLAQIYNRSKMAFNTQIHISGNSGFSFRVFDILSCKTLLLTESITRLPFEQLGLRENEDFVCYDSVDSLKQKCRYYLSHEDERLAITESAYQKSQARRLENAIQSQLARCFEQVGFTQTANKLYALQAEALLNIKAQPLQYLGKELNPHIVRAELAQRKAKNQNLKPLWYMKTKLGKNYRLNLNIEAWKPQ
jgi:hypothetical protein